MRPPDQPAALTKAEGTQGYTVYNYLLSPDAMAEGQYPVPTYPVAGRPGLESNSTPELRMWAWRKSDGSIETPFRRGRPGPVRILGVDCEMVWTEAGQALARISLVDIGGETVLDRLVMPQSPITDYATQWSGITPDTLLGVTTTLEDVHVALTQLIDYNTILVGHSIDCDLRAMRLAHPWIIDTSVIFQHTRGPPLKPSLKWLAQKWLEREIQIPKRSVNGVPVGHDSVEDALTAVDLLKLKLARGPGFGEFANDGESIFERLSRVSRKSSAVVDHGQPQQWHGAKATVAVPCTTDEEVLAAILAQVQQHDLVYARFNDLYGALGCASRWARSCR